MRFSVMAFAVAVSGLLSSGCSALSARETIVSANDGTYSMLSPIVLGSDVLWSVFCTDKTSIELDFRSGQTSSEYSPPRSECMDFSPMVVLGVEGTLEADPAQEGYNPRGYHFFCGTRSSPKGVQEAKLDHHLYVYTVYPVPVTVLANRCELKASGTVAEIFDMEIERIFMLLEQEAEEELDMEESNKYRDVEVSFDPNKVAIGPPWPQPNIVIGNFISR